MAAGSGARADGRVARVAGAEQLAETTATTRTSLEAACSLISLLSVSDVIHLARNTSSADTFRHLLSSDGANPDHRRRRGCAREHRAHVALCWIYRSFGWQRRGRFRAPRGGAFDVILSDMRMPGLSGIDVLRKLRENRVDSVFMIMTGFGTIETAVEAMQLGAVDFVQKPFFRDELLMRVRAAADRRQLARQVDLLERHIRAGEPLDKLIGESAPMQQVKALIRRAAPAPGTVLITGETGTGKELAARAIHAASSRAEGPFVAFNCAALTESLLENELFGHGKGAFTGAEGARPGLIEHASGGTLFFDEVGTMSTTLQAKLLRAVEAGEVRRIGENDPRTVDVRFVAATNVDLKAAVDAGDFRRAISTID